MQLPLQDFPTLVRNMVAGVQGSCRQLLDLSAGSVLRAILEANASLALWLQWLILQVLSATRAATSTGADLDSWVADFGLARLPASPAAGQATFSRITPGLGASIPAGALVRTADGTQSFAVAADPANPAWTGGGFALAPAATSLILPIQATAPGSAGNVQPGTISLLASAIPGVDAVTNVAATTGGLDAENDDALRARFANWMASRSRSTPAAVLYAVDSVQQGLSRQLVENVDAAGNPRPGAFVVTVDDGTGAPSASLLASVAAAVEAVRPVGSAFAVQPPTVLRANVGLTVSVADPARKAGVVGPVAAAVTALVNALPIGGTLPLTRVAAAAYAAHPAVTNVSAVTLNGAAQDLSPPVAGVIKAGLVAVI